MVQTFVLQVEVDSTQDLAEVLRLGHQHNENGVSLTFTPSEEGRGFGLTELVDVTVQVGIGVSSAVIAEAIRQSIKAVIRRVRSKSHRSDGGTRGVIEVIEKARTDAAVNDARSDGEAADSED